MSNVIIRVELRGDPGADVYKELHKLMTEKLKWQITIAADDGSLSGLPYAMYSGSTDTPVMDIAASLRKRIASEIWSKGAIVLAIAWESWGQSGQP